MTTCSEVVFFCKCMLHLVNVCYIADQVTDAQDGTASNCPGGSPQAHLLGVKVRPQGGVSGEDRGLVQHSERLTERLSD